jgi:hypothetical protein
VVGGLRVSRSAEIDGGLSQCITFAIELLKQCELGPGLKAVLVAADMLVQ